MIAWVFLRLRHRCLYRRTRHIWPCRPEGDVYRCILCDRTLTYPSPE